MFHSLDNEGNVEQGAQFGGRRKRRLSRCAVAILLLIDNRVKRLPVLNRQGQAVGFTSRRLLLNGLFNAAEPPAVM